MPQPATEHVQSSSWMIEYALASKQIMHFTAVCWTGFSTGTWYWNVELESQMTMNRYYHYSLVFIKFAPTWCRYCKHPSMLETPGVQNSFSSKLPSALWSDTVEVESAMSPKQENRIELTHAMLCASLVPRRRLQPGNEAKPVDSPARYASPSGSGVSCRR